MLKNTWFNGKIYDPCGVVISNPDIYYPTLESWEETEKNKKYMAYYSPEEDSYLEENEVDITFEGTSDPKDHKVTCNITMSANDYEDLKKYMPQKYFDELETKRELEIMHQVRQMPGRSMIEKADNAIAHWCNERQSLVRTDNNRYKLKYRY